MRNTLYFYSGPDCHLCDLAADILSQVEDIQNWDLQKINIRDDHQLMHLYSARIPVLKRPDNQAELGWPFTREDVEALLQ